MRGRYAGKNTTRKGEKIRAGAGSCPDADVPGVTVCKAGDGKLGSECSIYGSDKVYLGVRVRMPVRDLLRNIRLSKGQDPEDQRRGPGGPTGSVKRARARSRNHTKCFNKIMDPMKSLEELAIIVEVLEEDLRTGNTCRSLPGNLSASSSPVNPEMSPSGYRDEDDAMLPSPESYTTFSPGMADFCQGVPPPDCMFSRHQPSGAENMLIGGESGEDGSDLRSCRQDVSGSAFFWMQLGKEENRLRGVSDAELLMTDEHGRTALHNVVCVGKRALGYAIAKRMAAINSLDVKDCDGMTALLYAAKYNQHLMMADLIHLEADVNERNSLGKSCLHLSAEKGYIRVLEVLKQTMMDGVYIDVEAADYCGMSALQCASVALKKSICEVRSSRSSTSVRLHMLQQEQMMETFECLLQMDSYLHTAVGQSTRGGLTNAAQRGLSSHATCPPGHF
ncbi:unnamed protein product [Menidia menidia]|uniref:(Atlantic silverside) hypothetical protein n=1 Tax=Menidia menidia TaxID=238744 RepID=A0A8S4BSF4_9TELE|nr:unnamed protein product [Menidia menidia]